MAAEKGQSPDTVAIGPPKSITTKKQTTEIPRIDQPTNSHRLRGLFHKTRANIDAATDGTHN